MIMKGKKGVILGIANKKSIAYGIAKACQEQGAEMAITFLNERFEQKLAPIAEDLECGARLYPCDVSKPEEIVALKESLEKDMGEIDFIVHSIAFAPKEGLSGRFYDISKEAFDIAMDISVCKILGIEPVGIPVLKRAKVRGLWPERIDYPIQGPEDVADKGFNLPNTADHLLTGKKPPRKSPVITDKCTACGDCENICPKDAVKVKGQMAEVTYSKCIRCFCCHEVCPEDAIVLRSVKLK